MNSLPDNFNILVVEDNPADFFILEGLLQNCSLQIGRIFSADRISEAKNILQENNIHIVLLDLSLPDSFGIESLREISDYTANIPVIVLTGLSDSQTALEALQQHAQDYLVKGELDTSLLVKSIEYGVERKQVQEKIKASEFKYRQMFYRNPFPMWINDENSLRILEVNDAAIQKYGYSREEFLELNLDDLQYAPTVNKHQHPVYSNENNISRHRKKNGDLMYVEFNYYPIPYLNGSAMQAQVNDISERIRLENELSLKKQKLVEAVLDAQENERKKLGGELHDNINQILTAVKLNLGFALDRPEHSATLIAKCLNNTTNAIEEIRKLSRELILPGNLRELGLSVSIDELLKQALSHTGILYSFHVEGDEECISQEQKLAVYRIVQEQLNNILKHADAQVIEVILEMEGQSINLSVSDDGIGFTPTARRRGVGITNIMSRAELFSGEAKIISSPGNGCTLKVHLQEKKDLSPRPVKKIQELNPG